MLERPFLSFTVHPRSPALSAVTGSFLRPATAYMAERRSLLPLEGSSRSIPGVIVPLITLKKDTSPRCGSTSFLYMKSEAGPSSLQEGAGTTFLVNSRSLLTPISFLALTQNTGYASPATMPRLSPLRISSSVRLPDSKNFSIRVSSYSAALSISSWRISSACSLRFSGISRSSRVPLLSLK